MPSQVLLEIGTPIILANSDHAPSVTGNNLGTRTDQISLSGLADGAYRQSDKIDFGGGTSNWAPEWTVDACFEPSGAPTAGTTVEYYVGFSQSVTAGQDNPGKLVGADSAYVGYGSASTDADEAVKQLTYIGSLVLTADAYPQTGPIGTIGVPYRYGTLVVNNNAGVSHAADGVEASIRFTPVIPEGQ